MAIGDNELSVQDAMPIELYEISYTGNFWYYTSSDTDIVMDGRTYRALPITHPEIEPPVDVETAGLEVTFPRDVGFAEVFRVQPPSEVVSFTLLVQNYLIPNEYVVLWRGRIIDSNWNGPWVSVTVESVFSSLNRPGLRRRYSATCPYALYGSQCRVPRDNFRENSTILGVNGLRVEVFAAIGKEDNYYAGGYVTWVNTTNGNTEKRMVRESIGASGTLILATIPVGIAGGIEISIYAGCDHLIGTCDSKFNNKDNCGATPYIPKKNPFGGTPLY